MHMKILAGGLAATAVLAVASAAGAATVIDFADIGTTVPSYSKFGVTFTPNGTGNLDPFAIGADTPNGTRGIIALGIGGFRTIHAVISGGTDAVSVDIGDFDDDADDLFLRAYDALNNLLGSDGIHIAADFTGMKTLSVTAAGIDHVDFGGVGDEGSSVYGDNFTFGPGSTGGGVPEPAPWALMLLGFGALGATMRAHRRTLAA